MRTRKEPPGSLATGAKGKGPDASSESKDCRKACNWMLASLLKDLLTSCCMDFKLLMLRIQPFTDTVLMLSLCK